MIPIEEVKRKLTRFVLLFLIVILGVGALEFIIRGEVVMASLWLFISPSVTGLYIIKLAMENSL